MLEKEEINQIKHIRIVQYDSSLYLKAHIVMYMY